MKEMFSLPSVQLRSETPAVIAATPDIAMSDQDFLPRHPRETDRDEFEFQLYKRIERGRYLTPPPPKPTTAFGRFMHNTFEPEVFSVGKTRVSCTIVTAIKRKNPLCLLNPLFLNVSW